MPITEEVRKAVTNPTPLYFVVGSAELALQQAKKVPGAIEQLAADAPARLDAVRNANPKDVQDRAAARAKEAREAIQAKVGEFFGVLDTDLKRIGENAQDFALRGVGVAVEYAVQARETYEKVAEHGEQTVRNLRGEAADELVELADTVEPDAPEAAETSSETSSETSEAAAEPEAATSESEGEGTAARKPAAKKTTARKTTAKKTTPPAK